MVKHPHVWIMSDDMYEHLVFDGFKHATIAQVAPELRDRTVTISGASKAYAMTGWRIGFAGGPKNLIRAMVNMQGQATAGVSTVGQAAAAAALDGPQDGVAEQIVAYRNRRDMAVEMLNACRGINCHKPEGAFYVFPNVAGCIGRTTAGGRKLATDQDVCMALAGGGACRDGARRGVRHEPVSACQHRHGRCVAGRGVPAHRGVLRRSALSGACSPRHTSISQPFALRANRGAIHKPVTACRYRECYFPGETRIIAYRPNGELGGPASRLPVVVGATGAFPPPGCALVRTRFANPLVVPVGVEARWRVVAKLQHELMQAVPRMLIDDLRLCTPTSEPRTCVDAGQRGLHRIPCCSDGRRGCRRHGACRDCRVGDQRCSLD